MTMSRPIPQVRLVTMTRVALDMVILHVLGEYPWMFHEVTGDPRDAAWEIDDEFGDRARVAWESLHDALFLRGLSG